MSWLIGIVVAVGLLLIGGGIESILKPDLPRDIAQGKVGVIVGTILIASLTIPHIPAIDHFSRLIFGTLCQ